MTFQLEHCWLAAARIMQVSRLVGTLMAIRNGMIPLLHLSPRVFGDIKLGFAIGT